MEYFADLAGWGYLGLFIATFLAGSVLPFSSEIVLATLLIGGLNPFGCIIAATAGNWLGGMTCYWVGRLGKINWVTRYFGIKPDKLARAQQFLHGKGALMAFFSFLPAIGDLFIVALGFMRANLLWVSVSMLAGKFLRYVVATYLTLEAVKLF